MHMDMTHLSRKMRPTAAVNEYPPEELGCFGRRDHQYALFYSAAMLNEQRNTSEFVNAMNVEMMLGSKA